MYALIFTSLVIITRNIIVSETSSIYKFHRKISLHQQYFASKQLIGALMPYIVKHSQQGKEPFSYDLWFLVNQGPVCAPLGLLKLHIILYSGKSKKVQNDSKLISSTPRNKPECVSTSEPPPSLKDDEIDFLRYHSLDKINKYMDNLRWKYPHLVHFEVLGKSFENREIKLVKISTGDVATKANIMIVGGMNSNEWISTSTVLYAIEQLVENPVNYYLLGQADWFLLPIANPDGYEYSYQKNHTWKKTRSQNNNTKQCIGVDLNKNFDHQCYISNLTNDSCDEFYAGTAAFSEPEALALSTFIEFKRQIQLYINIRNYGQSLEFSVQNTDRFAHDFKDLQYFADQASYAMHKYGGHKYEVRSADTLEACGSEHWARRAGVKYVYNLKLPLYGKEVGHMQVPESKILSVAQEVFVAFREFHQILASIYSVSYDLITDD